jgi:hypothetical protein
MHAMIAHDFATDVVSMYNASAGSISKGIGVMRLPNTSQTVPNAANPHSPVSCVRGIVPATASINEHQHNFLGVALEDIPASTFGCICIGGPCQIKIGTSASYTACCPLGIDSASAGKFIEIAIASTADAFSVPVLNLAATVDVAIDDLVPAFIEPVKMCGGFGKYL